MLDRLPMPHITATKTEEQLAQIRDYLFHFKEELEFILMNISIDNLSSELVEKLNSLGADIESGKKENEDLLQQIGNKALTVYDVVKSPLFRSEIESKVPKVKDIINDSDFKEDLTREIKSAIPTFTINFENGNLEYK